MHRRTNLGSESRVPLHRNRRSDDIAEENIELLVKNGIAHDARRVFE
jgi:hypothetical protein